MTPFDDYNLVLTIWLATAAGCGLFLCFVAAPYGRHARSGWGPTVPNRLGWILMEAPTLVAFNLFWWQGSFASTPTALVFFGLWHLHYINRTLVFPFRIRGGARKRMPVMVMGSGVCFNIGNAYLQATWITELSGGYGSEWLTRPECVLGILLFLVGFRINLQSDAILRNLRQPGETGYKIPRGGLFERVSAPNYFGEFLEWTGWAVATWSAGGAMFAIWTFANLFPRALSNHRWYQDKFGERYPAKRRAFFPSLR